MRRFPTLNEIYDAQFEELIAADYEIEDIIRNIEEK